MNPLALIVIGVLGYAILNGDKPKARAGRGGASPSGAAPKSKAGSKTAGKKLGKSIKGMYAKK